MTRSKMVKYLLRETRYTIHELSAMSDATITRYYKEEKECNTE